MMVDEQTKEPIKVLVVDDHPVVRDGLRLFLTVTPGMDCVGEASDGEQAIRLCAEKNPDVILMDLMMPGMDGVSATRVIRERYPQTQVVALTSFDDKHLIQQAIQAGAMGYLLKNSSMQTLAEAIQAAYAGKSAISPELIRSLASISPTEEKVGSDLTEREKEVLKWMAEGLTNSAIAKKLFISDATARFHVSNVLAKLGVTNRTEAVRLAMKHHLID
jgi:NarL family two-component system response regulator LiaR